MARTVFWDMRTNQEKNTPPAYANRPVPILRVFAKNVGPNGFWLPHSNDPYPELYGAVFDDFCTDRKLSVSSFQRRKNRRKRHHTSRDMARLNRVIKNHRYRNLWGNRAKSGRGDLHTLGGIFFFVGTHIPQTRSCHPRISRGLQ